MTQISKTTAAMVDSARLEAVLEITRNIGNTEPAPAVAAGANPGDRGQGALQPALLPPVLELPRTIPGLPTLAGLSPPAAQGQSLADSLRPLSGATAVPAPSTQAVAASANDLAGHGKNAPTALFEAGLPLSQAANSHVLPLSSPASLGLVDFQMSGNVGGGLVSGAAQALSAMPPGDARGQVAASAGRQLAVEISSKGAVDPAQPAPGAIGMQAHRDVVELAGVAPPLASIIHQLGRPVLLDWTAKPNPASNSPSVTEAAGASRDQFLPKTDGASARMAPTAASFEKGLDERQGRGAAGPSMPDAHDIAMLQGAKPGPAAETSLRQEPPATGLAPPSLFGGEPSPARNGASIPGVILNAAMIPGWPAQRPYANGLGETASKAGQKPPPAMTDEEIMAYLVNFGADEKMLSRARKMLATPVVGKKLMTFLAVMMTAMSTVLRSVKDELEAMLAEQEEEARHDTAHRSLAGQRQPKRARLFLK